MTVTDTKKKQTQAAEWLKTHTLNDDQLKELIAGKFVRASKYHEALKKQEAKLTEGQLIL
jgi:hypothetical protein